MARGGRDRRLVAPVGTGLRGVAIFDRELLRDFGEHVDLVGICDVAPGRLRYADQLIGADCPTFSDLGEMMAATQPEWLIVTSWDREHHRSSEAT